VSKTGDGLAVSAKVFSQDSRIVAEVVDNEFHINPNNFFRRERPDKHTLIVYDQQGREALNIRFLNPSSVRVSGIFFHPNRATPLVISQDRVTLSGGSVIIGSCHKGSTGIIKN
jgi:hypothetical protein